MTLSVRPPKFGVGHGQYIAEFVRVRNIGAVSIPDCHSSRLYTTISTFCNREIHATYTSWK